MAFIELAQVTKKATYPNSYFIVGVPGSHEDGVNFWFNETYPNQLSRRIQGRSSFSDLNGNWLTEQRKRSIAFECTLTLISYVSEMDGNPFTDSNFWNLGNCYVCALGPNSNLRISVPLQNSICISAGPVDRRTLAFGPALEFWEIQTENSWATPVAAARLLQIKDTLQCSWWEVRYRARITAIRTNITHPSGELWNEQNGFGRIDVAAAIAWTGTIPPDPFLNNGNVYLPFVP